MFTGIIETIGTVERIEHEGTNAHFVIRSVISEELKIDQSVSHNGVCLTVVALLDGAYRVTAIEETLNKTNLGTLYVGAVVNLERAVKLGDRLDGHIVQGHVDTTAKCTAINSRDGSYVYRFEYSHADFSTVEKGSITVDGVSLTVVDSGKGFFTVAIIPYTYAHTNFNTFQEGSLVNLEFDVIGKYVARLMRPYLQ